MDFRSSSDSSLGDGCADPPDGSASGLARGVDEGVFSTAIALEIAV